MNKSLIANYVSQFFLFLRITQIKSPVVIFRHHYCKALRVPCLLYEFSCHFFPWTVLGLLPMLCMICKFIVQAIRGFACCCHLKSALQSLRWGMITLIHESGFYLVRSTVALNRPLRSNELIPCCHGFCITLAVVLFKVFCPVLRVVEMSMSMDHLQLIGRSPLFSSNVSAVSCHLSEASRMCIVCWNKGDPMKLMLLRNGRAPMHILMIWRMKSPGSMMN